MSQKGTSADEPSGAPGPKKKNKLKAKMREDTNSIIWFDLPIIFYGLIFRNYF